MAEAVAPLQIAVFVSGHTHAPAMSKLTRGDGRETVIVNTGCFASYGAARPLLSIPHGIGFDDTMREQDLIQAGQAAQAAVSHHREIS